jgi:hypothetical protein
MYASTQREAIDELKPVLKPLVLRPGQRFFLGRQEVFFCGRSISPFFSPDPVAVFCAEPPTDARGLITRPLDCRGAVFLRSVETGREKIESALFFGHGGAAVEVVEALTVVDDGADRLVIGRAGRKAFYLLLITAYRPGESTAGA